MNIWFVAAALIALALGGCATSNQPGTSSYVPVERSQIVENAPQPSDATGTATVVVKRDQGFMGVALTSVLTIDGRPTAKIRPGQFVSLRVAAGEHLFGVSSSDNLGPIATNISREVAADCKAGKTYYFRLFPQVGGGIVIDRVSQ